MAQKYIPPKLNDDPMSVEVRELIFMLRQEIGSRYMSLALRLQVERLEEMIGDAGTIPLGMTTVAA